jgi:hypothetical protein
MDRKGAGGAVRAVRVCALVVGVAAFACGSEDGGSSSSSSASSSSGGASSSTSSSGGSSSGTTSSSGASSSGATSSSGASTSGCPLPKADAECSVPDGAGFRVADSAVVTDASCKTQIYLTAYDTLSDADAKLRRYTVKTIEPCVLERDTTLPEVAARGRLAVDDGGNAYVAVTQPFLAMRRISPGPTVDCTNPTNVALPVFNDRQMVVSPDGKLGYGVFVKHDFDNDTEEFSILEMTADAASCSFKPFAISGATVLQVKSVTIDGKGRLHVADDLNGSPFGNERIVIVEANGAFVSEYKHPASGSTYWDPQNLMRCRRGVCMAAFTTIIAVDDDGALLDKHNWSGPGPGLGFSNDNFRSSSRGPVFYINEVGNPTRIFVSIMKGP